MKIVKKLLLFVVVLTSFWACEKAPTTIDDATPCFVGTVIVDDDGKAFMQHDIEVLAEYDHVRGVVDIKMKKVRFASAMPRLDITIPGCPAYIVTDDMLSSAGDGPSVAFIQDSHRASTEGLQAGDIVFSGEGIVPYAVGQKYPKYTVTSLKGRISGNSISYSLNFGKYPVTYEGTLRD